jgi:hypothetical protein
MESGAIQKISFLPNKLKKTKEKKKEDIFKVLYRVTL